MSRLRLVLWAVVTAGPAAILSVGASDSARVAGGLATPELVRDLSSTQGVTAVPTTTLEIVPFGESWWFAADDGVHGWEVWRLPLGGRRAERMTDLCPGACSALPLYWAVFEGRLYFSAFDGVHGRELWSIDDAGDTEMIEVEPGLGGSSPAWMTPVGSLLYFSAFSSSTGGELWATDGTAAGTAPVLDIESGPQGSNPRNLTALGGRLLFTAETSVAGQELWRSDGTAQGTVQVAEICPGPQTVFCIDIGSYGPFAAVRGRVLFYGNNRTELWASDGTPGGTRLLRSDIPASYGLFFERLGDELYFPAYQPASGRELWKSDGTAQGTVQVADVLPGAGGSDPYPLAVVGDRLYFGADNNGYHLWVTDGTASGTALAHPLTPRPPVAALGSHLFFSADDGTSGEEPWITDGTIGGTHRLRDVNPGPEGAFERRFDLGVPVLDGERLLFFAFSRPTGYELWETDGTEAGTLLVDDLDVQPSSVPRGWDGAPASEAADFGGTVLFTAEEPIHGAELWRSDGTSAGTWLVRDIVPGPEPRSDGYQRPVGPRELTATPTRAYFAAEEEIWGEVLWRTDGSTAGTQPVEDPSGIPGLSPRDLLADPSPRSTADLVYAAVLNLEQAPVWRSDGTSAGTYPITSLSPGSLAVLGSRVLFGAGARLWGTDRATESVREIFDFGPLGLGPRFSWRPAPSLRGLVFAAADGLTGFEPWVTDGTGSGTRRIDDVRPGPEGSLEPRYPAAALAATAGSVVVFVADDGLSGPEPWVTDGNRAGPVADVRPGPVGSAPSRLTTFGAAVVFAADDGAHGRELWRSDGSRVGTTMIADLVPGPGSGLWESSYGATEAPVVWEGRLYFAARDESHGVELWSSDGTVAGTAMVADLNPGPEPSSPNGLTIAGDALFFWANDGTHGFELWRLAAAPPARR